ncbi:MAG: hypothetical protein B6V02_00655 [Thermoprotei archaeon ex4572_64]|nr:MAG: hypothetical protein B6V02_00655 [Thermoprotei archaeon ex4572_64]
MIVIPSIDLHQGCAVKRVQGIKGSEKVFMNPKDVLKIIVNYDVEKIHIVDLDGAEYGKPVHRELILELARIARNYGIKVQVGGGIRCLNHALEYAKHDIDIIIGSLAFKNRDETHRIVSTLGNDKVYLSIDVKNGKVMIKAWLECSCSEDYVFNIVNELNIKKVIYTNINVEGMLSGVRLNERVIRTLREYCNELQYAGGVSTAKDIEILSSHGFDAAIVGMALYSGKLEELLKSAKKLRTLTR